MEATGRGMLVCLKEEFGMDGPLRMWAEGSGALHTSLEWLLGRRVQLDQTTSKILSYPQILLFSVFQGLLKTLLDFKKLCI